MTVQRNGFLTDVLSMLFDRIDRLRDKSDARNTQDVCRALLSSEGVIAGQALATQSGDADHGLVATAIWEQRKDGVPLDPVARFHLGHGAQVYDIHADADSSATEWHNPAGRW